MYWVILLGSNLGGEWGRGRRFDATGPGPPRKQRIRHMGHFSKEISKSVIFFLGTVAPVASHLGGGGGVREI